jgi:PAS domain S-box-containing protein
MLKLTPSQLHRYAVPIFIVTLISLLDLALDPWIVIESPFLLFFAGVMASAWFGGGEAGALATVLAALAIDYLFLTPTHWFGHTLGQNLQLALFVLEGLWVSRAIGELSQFRGRAEAVGELQDGESLRQSQERDITEKSGAADELGSMAEITERVKASEALHRSQQEFKALIENTPDLVMRMDREYRYVYVNPEVERLTGMSAEAFTGKTSAEVGQPEELYRLWNETLRKVFETGQKQEIEYRSLTADGLRTYQSRAVPEFDKEGSPRYALVVIRDITELRQAEEKRAQLIREQAARAQAEESNRMKDEFLAIISHELRTPLTAIMGWVRLLRNQKFDEKKIDHGLETIERNAQLQAQLVNNILDISQIIKGKMLPNAGPTDLAAAINAAMETVRLAADAKSISLISALDCSVGPVLGDAERLQQVVWNLLSNAIKFTPSGGRVEVRLFRAGSCAQIQVSDTGCGISLEFLPYVFELFRQADSSSTRSYGGLGLGLAIVRRLVEFHGGSVCASSPGIGQGATFTVSLPLFQKSRRALALRNSGAAEISVLLTGLRVLVVDDEPDIRELIAAVLEQYGAEVTAVGSAGEAIAALARKVPDVLVSDIGMPVEDGYTLIRKVRDLEMELGGQIPALALTAYAREEEHRRAIAAGFHMHMPKPVESAELAVAIASLAQLKVKN